MFSNILIRGASGALFVLLVVGAIYFGNATFAALMAAAMLISLWEFYRMAQRLSASPQWIVGYVGAAIIFLYCYSQVFLLLPENVENILLYALLVPITTLCFFIELYRRSEHPFANIAYTLLGWVYVALPFALMNVVFAKGGASLMFCFFILLWANDTFAFLFGIAFGKHKLFLRHSPKKSWEGYIGGILSVLLIAALLHLCFAEIALVHIAAIGFIIATTAVLGDLVESMLKRNADVKDSGKIMPGHGGLLDRFDAALLSLPLVFAYVQLFF